MIQALQFLEQLRKIFSLNSSRRKRNGCGMAAARRLFLGTFVLLLLLPLALVVLLVKDNRHVRTMIPSIVYRSLEPTEGLMKQIDVQRLLLGMRAFEKKIYSQNGEDGVIEAIFNRIGAKTKYYVEFGTESGVQCNTRYLRVKKNWTGLLMDGGFENKTINLHKEMIFPSNILDLFKKYKVPKKFDLLSVDTDFKDWFILRNILKAGYRPRVLITECNTFIPDNEAKTVPLETNQTVWDGGSRYFGFSVKAGWILARHFGYSMVYCDVLGVNCFYVIDGEEGFGAGFRVSDFYPAVALWRRNGLGHAVDSKRRKYAVVSKEML